jgi:hypothetical protein
MFDARTSAIAFALTVAASTIPILGKALALRFRRGKKDAHLPVDPQKKVEFPFDDRYDESKARIKIKATQRVASVPNLSVALVALVVVGLSSVLISFVFIPAPSSGKRFLTLVSWLSQHEAFYQFMFLFAVLAVVLLNKRRITTLTGQLDASGKLLLCFAGVVVCFGGSAVIHFWNQISVSGDKMYLALGLFITMVAGMFVQVITSNYKAGTSNLFAVTTAQLIYPVLFSPIVYYAIWAVASASSSAGVFSFYAAFLNGYFWQSVVTSAQKASAASGTA